MDFLNHREGGMVFYPVFLLLMYNNFTVEICKRLRVFEKIKISRQSCKGDCE